MIGIGPKDKWQHDMEKLSRCALIEMVDELTYFTPDRDRLSKIVATAKEYGRYRSATERHQRFMADPKKAVAIAWRRSKAAKKAARQRKRRAA